MDDENPSEFSHHPTVRFAKPWDPNHWYQTLCRRFDLNGSGWMDVILCLTWYIFSQIPAIFFKGRAQWCKMSWDHKDYEKILTSLEWYSIETTFFWNKNLWSDVPIICFNWFVEMGTSRTKNFGWVTTNQPLTMGICFEPPPLHRNESRPC